MVTLVNWDTMVKEYWQNALFSLRVLTLNKCRDLLFQLAHVVLSPFHALQGLPDNLSLFFVFSSRDFQICEFSVV